MSSTYREPLPSTRHAKRRRVIRVGRRRAARHARDRETRRDIVAGVIRALVFGLGTGWLLWGGLQLVSVDARPAYCFGAGVAAVALLSLTRLAQESTDPFGQPDLPPVTDEPRTLAELATLEQQLAWGAMDADRLEARVRPRLVTVATERLRQRHGIDPAGDPDRARSLVGEELWYLMTSSTPIGRPLHRKELNALVKQIEAL